ncbi:Dephospho-CoA kinase [Corynebacterium felinum]|nr:Dephospho-CoA kinase [Corynebacterium felinum]
MRYLSWLHQTHRHSACGVKQPHKPWRTKLEDMKKIGLTGGIGSGKSTVAQLLAHAGLPIIDADKIAREIVEPGQPVLRQLADTFGEDILNPDGTLNRALLAQRAFATPEATEKLNTITHPAIEQRTHELFTQAASEGHQWAVWDMPLLVDKGHHTAMDVVIVVDVESETRVQRLVTHRGLDETDARARINAQIDDDQRRAAADYIIDNNSTPEKLAPQVATILEKITGVHA